MITFVYVPPSRCGKLIVIVCCHKPGNGQLWNFIPISCMNLPITVMKKCYISLWVIKIIFVSHILCVSY